MGDRDERARTDPLVTSRFGREKQPPTMSDGDPRGAGRRGNWLWPSNGFLASTNGQRDWLEDRACRTEQEWGVLFSEE